MTKIKTAIIPVGYSKMFGDNLGLIPEILPVVETPVIEKAIQEATEADVEKIVLVGTKENLKACWNNLHASDQILMEEVSKDSSLGTALLAAKKHVKEVTFALIDPVQLFSAKVGALSQLVGFYAQTKGHLFAVENMHAADSNVYPHLQVKKDDGLVAEIEGVVSNGSFLNSPSAPSIVGRAIFHKSLLATLEETNGDFHAALNTEVKSKPLSGVRLRGVRFNVSSPVDYQLAGIEFGMIIPEFSQELIESMHNIMLRRVYAVAS